METKAETRQELFDFAFVMKILSICNLLPLVIHPPSPQSHVGPQMISLYMENAHMQ